MPKNFQTSQYDEPICIDGYLDVEVDTDDGSRSKAFRVEIERVHMEEDTGKSLHVGGATGRIHGADYSLVDYNRAGIPLIEIVTKPVEGTGALAPEVARAYVTALRELMRTLGVSDVRMEQGSLRCDVNLSLRRSPSRPARHPLRDQERQLAALGGARRPLRDPAAGRRADQRRPGRAGDPALPRGHRHHDVRPVQGGGRGLPLLPGAGPGAGRARPGVGRGAAGRPARRPRPCAAASCRRSGASPTTRCSRWSTPAPSTWSRAPSPPARRRTRPASGGWASWPGTPTSAGVDLAELPITPAQVARVVALVESGALNDKLARQVIEGVLAGEGDPDEVVAARGLAVVSDDRRLLAAVDEAIAANPDVAEKIRGGKVAAAGALVGAVMKATRGQADAGRVRELVLERCGQA